MTDASRLGKDYALGCFIDDPKGAVRHVRLQFEKSRIDQQGVEEVQSFMDRTGVKKFMLVPVAEYGSVIEALKAKLSMMEAYHARFTKCTVCETLGVEVAVEGPVCKFCLEIDEASS